MLFFRVSFSPIFSRTGYQSKDVFLEQVVKKAHFSRVGYYFSNARFNFYGFVNLSEFIQLSHGLCSNFLRPIRNSPNSFGSAIHCCAGTGYTLQIFSRTGYRFQEKILEQVKHFFCGMQTPPYKKSQVPPPGGQFTCRDHLL